MPSLPRLLPRLAVVWLLAWSSTATAADWHGAEPGVTRTQELLQRFGKPARRTQKGGLLLLDYRGKTLPRDTRGVRFYVDPEQDLLQRIDVFPRKPLTRTSLEEDFGPACAKEARPETPCYEVQATADNQLSFLYPALGMEARFQRGRVSALTWQEPRRPSAASPEKPAPEVEEPPRAAEVPAPAATEVSSPTTEVSASTTEASTPAEPSPPVAAADDDLMPKRPTVVTDASTADSDTAMRPAEVSPPSEPGPSTLPGRVTITDAGAPSSSLEKLGREPRDILSLGGVYFQRAELSGTRQPLGTTLTPAVPSLVDLFVDVKPSESVRSFVRGRLLYDPLDPALSTPEVLLDQLWFQFGIADRVFVTAGRQQIKWGTSKVWNPVDFLRQPNPLPLDVFDLRTGVDMVKVNVPFESLASNLWLIATADLHGTGEQKVRYGGAARAEVVLGPGELGLTGVFQQGRRPRYGLDWSMGVGMFDINAELALLRDSASQQWEQTGSGFTPKPFGGPKLQASGGVTALFRLADIYRLQLRLEGFYNELGYQDTAMLTWLRSTGDYQPLYFGRYYGMAQLTINRRSAFEPMLALTVLGNVLDRSYLSRLDVAVLPLREVYVSAFLEAPLGTRGGEFRFEPDPTVAELPATGLSLLRTGLSVRVRM